METLIAPSLLSADFSNLAEEISQVQEAGAHWLHLDIMDGHFVPNITFGPPVVAAIKKVSKLPLDVHLMIENPDFYLEDFARAGADYISVHVETGYHLHRTISRIQSLGVRAGVVLNPATPLSSLEEILPMLDLVLLMSVNPGFGGQKFIPQSLDKIRRLKEIAQRVNPSLLIEVDGGVGPENASDLVKAGASVLVAGNSIFGRKDRRAAIDSLKKAVEDKDK